jgi:hypothetical protein
LNRWQADKLALSRPAFWPQYHKLPAVTAPIRVKSCHRPDSVQVFSFASRHSASLPTHVLFFLWAILGTAWASKYSYVLTNKSVTLAFVVSGRNAYYFRGAHSHGTSVKLRLVAVTDNNTLYSYTNLGGPVNKVCGQLRRYQQVQVRTRTYTRLPRTKEDKPPIGTSASFPATAVG